MTHIRKGRLARTRRQAAASVRAAAWAQLTEGEKADHKVAAELSWYQR